jgi:hypothetical protein
MPRGSGGSSGIHDGQHWKRGIGLAGKLVESVLSAKKRKKSGTVLLTTQSCFENVHGRGRSSGGSDQHRRRLGRHSGGREREPQALHDPVTILLDKKHHVRDMITPGKENIEAKEHFTNGVSSGGGEMQRRRRW